MLVLLGLLASDDAKAGGDVRRQPAKSLLSGSLINVRAEILGIIRRRFKNSPHRRQRDALNLFHSAKHGGPEIACLCSIQSG
jgi:hypothetical protein